MNFISYNKDFITYKIKIFTNKKIWVYFILLSFVNLIFCFSYTNIPLIFKLFNLSLIFFISFFSLKINIIKFGIVFFYINLGFLSFFSDLNYTQFSLICFLFLIFFNFAFYKFFINKINYINKVQYNFSLNSKKKYEKIKKYISETQNSILKINILNKKTNLYNSLNELFVNLNNSSSFEQLDKNLFDILKKIFSEIISSSIKIRIFENNKNEYFAFFKQHHEQNFDKFDFECIENNKLKIIKNKKHNILIFPLIFKKNTVGVFRISTSNDNNLSLENIRYLSYICNIYFNKFLNLKLFEKATKLAEIDGLTQLYKRWWFDKALASEFKRAIRYEKKLALLMIDIDNFRNFNNNHGHLVGDNILKNISEIIIKSINFPATASRYGGEEIAIILPEINSTASLKIAENIRENIFNLIIDNIFKVTVSIGTAELTENNIKSPFELVKKADQALYYSKISGKNKVTLCKN